MSLSDTEAAAKVRLIRAMRSAQELDAYEAESRKRGITGDEVRALWQQRRELAGRVAP